MELGRDGNQVLAEALVAGGSYTSPTATTPPPPSTGFVLPLRNPALNRFQRLFGSVGPSNCGNARPPAPDHGRYATRSWQIEPGERKLAISKVERATLTPLTAGDSYLRESTVECFVSRFHTGASSE